MKPFALCFFVAALSGGVLSAGLRESKWAAFKAAHGKFHPAHEEEVRMARFLERDADIEAHNAKFAKGEVSFSRRHNRFSDLSNEEVAKFAFGLRVPANVSDIPRAQLMPSGELPAKFDWRDKNIMTPVTDQGNCGSCYAFAGAGALEGYLKWKTGKEYNLAEQGVVDCSYEKYDGFNNGCDGGWPTAVYQYYDDFDVLDEKQYPYTSGESETHGTCKFPTAVNNVVKQKLKIENVKPNDEHELAHILMEKGPLVITIGADNEYKRFFLELGDGVFDNDDAVGLTPNHAVVLVGFGNQDGKDYWLFKNSWGDSWATGGYGKMARGRNMCGIMEYGIWYVEGL